MATSASIRDAAADDLEPLAILWHGGWHDAHAALVPVELTQQRTPASFLARLQASLPHVRVAGPVGTPLGFHLLKDDEVNQFYVAAAARGTGLAATLMVDAEARLAARGVRTAWLACVVGNARAARFYEKCGWHRAATAAYPLEAVAAPLSIDVWRYEKRL